MAPKPLPHFFGYNAHSYCYPKTSHSKNWQDGHQYHYGQPSQSWQQGWIGPNHSNHSHHSYPAPMQSYPPTYAAYPIPQPSFPQLSQPMPPLPLPPPFRPS